LRWIFWCARAADFARGCYSECKEHFLGRTLFICSGGHLALPDKGAALLGREDGGNLLVNPPREVWERGELMPAELTDWSFLIAAAGQAMLRTLPQLELGCINYWKPAIGR
jgi:hypothetical protein